MKIDPDTDVVFDMPQYYFDIATYSPGDKSDPENDKIISIQYQKIDFRSGKPIQDIEILKEWKSSEEAIVTQFFNKFFRGGQNKWIFIPVGYNLNTAWEAITLKFEHYFGNEFKNKGFHFTIPHIDLESVVVLLNGGNFIGARLEKFTKQPSGKRNIKGWYESEDFEAIEDHITTSAASFLTFYQKVKKNMPFILEERKPELRSELRPVPKPASKFEPKKEPVGTKAPLAAALLEPEPVAGPEPLAEKAAEPEPEPPVPALQEREPEKEEIHEEPPGEPIIAKEQPPEAPPDKPEPAPEIPAGKPGVTLPPPPPPTPSVPMIETEVEEERPEVHEVVEEHYAVETPGMGEAEFAPEALEIEAHEEEEYPEHAGVEDYHTPEAEFAPEAVEVETHEGAVEANEMEPEELHDVEAVEVEAEEHHTAEPLEVEAHEMEAYEHRAVEGEEVEAIEGEAIEAEVHNAGEEIVEAIEEPSAHAEALSPKELKKKLKEEAKKKKMEEKLRKKQRKLK